MEEFCIKDFPEAGPEFFIFNSIEFDEDNEDIRKEIETSLKTIQLPDATEEDAVQNPRYVTTLSELGMVESDDLKEWFTDYEDLWDGKLAFKRTQKKWLKEAEDEMYMEEVQELLEEIIIEINNAEKNANRNS